MGTHNWMLVYADGNPKEALSRHPTLDREATLKFAQRLFPNETLTPGKDSDLGYTCANDDELVIGCFPGVAIVSTLDLALDKPSTLPPRFIEAGARGSIWLHNMHSGSDYFSFAQWTNGKLDRSFSISHDSGIVEDIGQRLPFEEPYWAGEHPMDADDYPYPFHPLDMADAALKALFGYTLLSEPDTDGINPVTIPLMCFERSQSVPQPQPNAPSKPRPRWKFWG